MSLCDQPFCLKIIIGQHDLYFMSSDFALYLDDFLVDEHRTLG